MAHYSGPYPGTQSQQSTPVLRRNTQSRNLAAERDKFRCVVTGDPVVEVVHIYPYHSIKHREEDASGQRHVVWNQLKMFWPEEKVAAWEAELFPAGISELGVERVYNLITLSRNAYYLWGHGTFSLEPISESDDKKTLEVQFFWQKKQTDGRQAMCLSTSPFSTEGLDENTGSLQLPARLYDDSNDQRIKSGFCFKLHTDDPTNKPLPSFQLLELQWFLQRVQGMAGAADVDWPSLSDSESDEEEIPDYGIY